MMMCLSAADEWKPVRETVKVKEDSPKNLTLGGFINKASKSAFSKLQVLNEQATETSTSDSHTRTCSDSPGKPLDLFDSSDDEDESESCDSDSGTEWRALSLTQLCNVTLAKLKRRKFRRIEGQDLATTIRISVRRTFGRAAIEDISHQMHWMQPLESSEQVSRTKQTRC